MAAFLSSRLAAESIEDFLDGREPDLLRYEEDVDREIMEMLDKAAVNYQLVLTKADKVKPTELAKTLERTIVESAKHPAAHPQLIATSSETGGGIAELRTAILQAATS